MTQRTDGALELPYGAEFSFVDSVVAFEANQSIETTKHYSCEMPLIAAHFVNGPKIVPGVLLVEQICQSAFLLGLRSALVPTGATPRLGKIEVRFLRPVMAGATVHASVKLDTCLREVITFHGNANANGEAACEMSGMVVVRKLDTIVDDSVPNETC